MPGKKYNASKVLGREVIGSLGTAYGDEGGYVPAVENNREAFQLISAAIKLAGYNQNGKIDVALAIDGAMSEWDTREDSYDAYKGKRTYRIKKPLALKDGTELGTFEDGKWTVEASDLTRFYVDIATDDSLAPFYSIEDGHGENDINGWRELTQALAKENETTQGLRKKYEELYQQLEENFHIRMEGAIQVVTDDTTVTNPEILKVAIEEEWGTTLLDKINQIGTLTEAYEASKMAFDAGWNTVISHRSGETEDATIAHLSVAWANQIKTGAPNRTDRNAKYNELLRIEERLSPQTITSKITSHRSGETEDTTIAHLSASWTDQIETSWHEKITKTSLKSVQSKETRAALELLKEGEVKARQILDSRGNPTVEAEVVLPDGKIIRVAVPSGASTGQREAVELRDGGKAFGGKGVTKAVANFDNEIIPNLIEKFLNNDFTIFDQDKIDQFIQDLDGTPNKSRLGANATLAASILIARIGAYLKGYRDDEFYKYVDYEKQGKDRKIPLAMMNVLNGGRHAPDGPDIQEFMIAAVSAKSAKEQIRIGSEVFHCPRCAL